MNEYKADFFAKSTIYLHSRQLFLHLQFAVAMRTLLNKHCHNDIPFFVEIWTKKEAHSEEVPIPAFTTTLQKTHIEMCRANIHGHTDSKCFLQSSIYEVVIQEWTFTISLPNFLFSDFYLCLYLYCFFGNATRTPFNYNLSCRMMKCKK